jgi:hypothetical protein
LFRREQEIRKVAIDGLCLLIAFGNGGSVQEDSQLDAVIALRGVVPSSTLLIKHNLYSSLKRIVIDLPSLSSSSSPSSSSSFSSPRTLRGRAQLGVKQMFVQRVVRYMENLNSTTPVLSVSKLFEDAPSSLVNSGGETVQPREALTRLISALLSLFCHASTSSTDTIGKHSLSLSLLLQLSPLIFLILPFKDIQGRSLLISIGKQLRKGFILDTFRSSSSFKSTEQPITLRSDSSNNNNNNNSRRKEKGESEYVVSFAEYSTGEIPLPSVQVPELPRLQLFLPLYPLFAVFYLTYFLHFSLLTLPSPYFCPLSHHFFLIVPSNICFSAPRSRGL